LLWSEGREDCHAHTDSEGPARSLQPGEITRREIEDRTGEVIGFGALLMALHAHHLPLPACRSI